MVVVWCGVVCGVVGEGRGEKERWLVVVVVGRWVGGVGWGEVGWGGVGWVVVVVRTGCMTTMFIRESQRMHRIEVAGHPGVGLLATRRPRALDDEELFVIESGKNGHSRPCGRSATNAAKCG